jgi:hypothetical protein
MPELSVAEVRALAAAIGLPLEGEDLAEVAHRLNAFVEALAGLATLDLAAAEPWPTPSPDPR